METERHGRRFKNGRNQAVRIPRDLELPGRDAVLRREGRRLVLEPMARPSLLGVLATLKPLDEEFALVEALPAESVDPRNASSNRTKKYRRGRLVPVPIRAAGTPLG